jgi:ribosomal protein S17
MVHPWKPRGEKRTIVLKVKQLKEILLYLKNVQDAPKYAIHLDKTLIGRPSNLG